MSKKQFFTLPIPEMIKWLQKALRMWEILCKSEPGSFQSDVSVIITRPWNNAHFLTH